MILWQFEVLIELRICRDRFKCTVRLFFKEVIKINKFATAIIFFIFVSRVNVFTLDNNVVLLFSKHLNIFLIFNLLKSAAGNRFYFRLKCRIINYFFLNNKYLRIKALSYTNEVYAGNTLTTHK